MSRLARGQQILVTETERGTLPAPGLATVFEDYGTDYVNVRLANGQIHAIRRAAILTPSVKKKSPAAAKKIAKDVEEAVKAAQLYHGSAREHMRIKDEQKLYDRMQRKIDAVARRRGIDRNAAYEQIVGEAKRRGGITPVPGKDI